MLLIVCTYILMDLNFHLIYSSKFLVERDKIEIQKKARDEKKKEIEVRNERGIYTWRTRAAECDGDSKLVKIDYLDKEYRCKID